MEKPIKLNLVLLTIEWTSEHIFVEPDAMQRAIEFLNDTDPHAPHNFKRFEASSSVITNIHENIMKTLSFEMQICGMRKPQNFGVYPMHPGSSSKEILIQSGHRIARLNTETGIGEISENHPNGAYGPHLSFDKLTKFYVNPRDLSLLKMKIFMTASSKAGDMGISTDNSGAINILS